MRKKLFTLFFALVAGVGTMFAESGTCGQNLTWDLTDGVLTISGTGEMTDYDWNGAPWYSYRSSITEVSIGNNVTSIGNYAFEGCTGLTSITIPNSVISIGGWAFYNCAGLTSITIPNSVTSIGEGAFSGCTGLTSVIIPNSVTSIESSAFSHCAGLTSVTIPNSVTSIPVGAFRGCTSLTSIIIPNSVTSIGRKAFENCTALTSIEIPNSVTSIGEDAFRYCTGLTSVTIPNSVTSIGGAAFCECISLASINIPNSVTSIGNFAFYKCTALTSITIPNSVTSIGNDAFSYCSGLTSITIPNSVTRIGIDAFSYCTGLTSIYNYSETPQLINSQTFYNVDISNCGLYVPVGSIDLYKAAEVWKEFTNILPISAEEKNVDAVEVETSESTASIAWPQVSGAYTYELVIKDKSGNVVCTLVFNAQGQLTQIIFGAPANGKAPQQTQSAGFSFVVTGLEEGTSYDLTITAKDENDNELDKKNVSFHTEGTQGIEDIHIDAPQSTKILLDGQIYILRGGHVYDAAGKMVK